MAWFDREFIAVPETEKNQLVYKWPDVNIRRYSRTIVNADEIALFVKSGHVIATMGPGRHRIDADELPVLGALVDSMSGGNFYRAELYFISSREASGIKFGGRLADIADPVSEQVVTLRVFGEFALRVRDPSELVTSMTGTSGLGEAASMQSWCAEMLLKSMKIAVAQGVSRGDWPIVGLSGYLERIEAAVLRHTNTALYEYGLRIPRLGNFDITLAPEDADRIKRLAKDRTYMQLAGDFRQYAAGELALGAGHGLANGNGAEGGFLGATLGVNALQQQTPAPAVPTAAAETQQPVCTGCRTTNPVGARFCTGCGARLETNTPRHCHGCGSELPAAARFCAACGEQVATS